MSTPEFVIETDPTLEDVQYLEDRLYEFNASVTGITDGEWLAIFVRDESGRIIAGICGNTWGGCCEIRQFWVEESRRRARVLTTFSFRAPAFYRKHGFRDLAATDDHPRGHQHLLLRKHLSPGV